MHWKVLAWEVSYREAGFQWTVQIYIPFINFLSSFVDRTPQSVLELSGNRVQRRPCVITTYEIIAVQKLLSFNRCKYGRSSLHETALTCRPSSRCGHCMHLGNIKLYENFTYLRNRETWQLTWVEIMLSSVTRLAAIGLGFFVELQKREVAISYTNALLLLT